MENKLDKLIELVGLLFSYTSVESDKSTVLNTVKAIVDNAAESQNYTPELKQAFKEQSDLLVQLGGRLDTIHETFTSVYEEVKKI